MTDIIDQIIIEFDKGLQSSFSNREESKRAYPGELVAEKSMNEDERNHSAGLMRVNHAGEVCAQALYRGQSIATQNKTLKEHLTKAADEEEDHLYWCNKRLNELQSNSSVLNPIWYGVSFSMGVLSGLAGDKWSLGFVEETEKQVVKHLDSHLDAVSKNDKRSKKIIKQMRKDEDTHAEEAKEAGASELPQEVKKGMSLVAKVMTSTSYYI